MLEKVAKGAPDKKIEKPKLRIQDEPILSAVYEGEDVDSEYELERRYIPAKYLSVEELEKLSGGEKREITQGYIRALHQEGKPATFRLRVTVKEGEEGTLYRVAHKLKIERSRGRVERQLKIVPEDSDTDDSDAGDSNSDADDFLDLWENEVSKSEVISKTRYYIRHTLPNGHACEIHYDIHHGRFQEFVRIEVEFIGATADEDHQYALDYGPEACLPKWVGDDVTEDQNYGGRALAENGLPPGALEAQRSLIQKPRAI